MRFVAIFLILLLSSVSLFGQEEKIYSFNSDVIVDKAGTIEVREKIRIYSMGDNFKRGITRSLPLNRTDVLNNRIKIDYTIKEVLLDGNGVNFFTEKEDGDLVIYVGDRDLFLEPNNYYTYEILYETAGQIGFFDDYDEISWNVNGVSNKMIDSVSALIQLPIGGEVLSSRCYTGKQGSTESNCLIETKDDGSLIISVDNLPAYEMLTVSIGFNKGVVAQPAGFEPKVITWFDKNGLAVISIFWVVLLLIYYRITWKRYGIDPPKPVVIPQFSPPNNLSPAAVGMLHKGYFIDDLITASIVNLSVKRYITIEEIVEKKGLFGRRKDKAFSLTKIQNADSGLSNEEVGVMRDLFSTNDKIILDGKYNKEIADMMQSYKSSLNKQFKPLLEEGQNLKFHILPWLALVLYIVALTYFISNDFMHFEANKYALIITIPLLSISYIIYAIQIVRPSERKLELKSYIEGLKMYLDIAEEKRIQFFNPPELTPEKFEELLPYAIALDMEEVWGEKFEKKLLSSTIQPEVYQPVWYTGSYVNAAVFAHVLNSSLSNTVSHAATPPTSSSGGNWSSGSFGGGFSGMGGGGGSVGGW